MKKKAWVIAALLCLASSSSVYADEVQDNFLKDMADGLNARWSYDENEEAMSSAEILEYREKLVNEEYSRLSKYADEEFESVKFGLLAQAYIEALEMQLDAIKYYTDLDGIYTTEWSTGYHLRALLITDFVDIYGLDVSEDDIEDFRVYLGDTEVAETETVTYEASEKIELFNDEGITVVLTGMEEPGSVYNTFNIEIENLNHHNISVQTPYQGIVVNGSMINGYIYEDVQAGKTATTTLDVSNSDLAEAGIEKIQEMSLTIEIWDTDSNNMLYEGERQYLVIDDQYNVSRRNVYNDTESIKKVQELLNQAGYDCGTADGVPGKKTNSALLQFEKDHGLEETTDITPELIEALEEAID